MGPLAGDSLARSIQRELRSFSTNLLLDMKMDHILYHY